LVECLYLAKNGVPFDVACSLTRNERLAWVVALGALEGRQFDWQAIQWYEPQR